MRFSSPDLQGPQPEGAQPTTAEPRIPELSQEAILEKFNTLKQSEEYKDVAEGTLWTLAIFELRQEQIGEALKAQTEKLTQEYKWQKFFQTKPGRVLNNVLTTFGGAATNVKIRSALSATVGFGWAAAIASGLVGGAVGAYKMGKEKEKQIYQAEKIKEELNLERLNQLLQISAEGEIQPIRVEDKEEITKAIEILDKLIDKGKLFGTKEEVEYLIDKRCGLQAFLETERTITALKDQEIPQEEMPSKVAEAFIAAQRAHLEGTDQIELKEKISQEAQRFLKEKGKQVNWARIKGGLIGAGIGAGLSGILTHFFHPATGFGGGEIDPDKAAKNAVMNDKFRAIAEKLTRGYLANDRTAILEAKKSLFANHINYDEKLAKGLRELVIHNKDMYLPETGELKDELVRAIYKMMSYPDQLASLAKTYGIEQLSNSYWIHHLSPVAQEVSKHWHQFIGATLAVATYIIAPAAAEAGYITPYILPRFEKIPSSVTERFNKWKEKAQEKTNEPKVEIKEKTVAYTEEEKDRFVEEMNAHEGEFIIGTDGSVYQIQKIESPEEIERAKRGETKVKKAILDEEKNLIKEDEWQIDWYSSPEKKYRIVKEKGKVKEILKSREVQ